MPQWLSSLASPDNRGELAALIGLLVVVLVIAALLLRMAFGNRLRVPGGGRARQPRLGVVDAFSLDGQRQLVLVRRDNVEHLLMIGGPNDVVVESQIVRGAAPTSATRERAEVTTTKAPALPSTPSAAMSASRQSRSPGDAAPTETATAASTPAVRPLPATPPSQIRPAESLPTPKAAVAPAPPSSAASTTPRPVPPPQPRPASLVRATLPQPIPPAVARPRTTPVAPMFAENMGVAKPQPGSSGEHAVEKATISAEGPAGIPAPEQVSIAVAKPTESVVISQVPKVEQKVSKPTDAFGDLDALEAEMAKLLGRDP